MDKKKASLCQSYKPIQTRIVVTVFRPEYSFSYWKIKYQKSHPCDWNWRVKIVKVSHFLFFFFSISFKILFLFWTLKKVNWLLGNMSSSLSVKWILVLQMYSKSAVSWLCGCSIVLHKHAMYSNTAANKNLLLLKKCWLSLVIILE